MLERRYVSRCNSASYARSRWRAARERGDEDMAREQWAFRDSCVGARAEIARIGRKLGIALDTHALNRRAIEREAEIEGTLRRFEASRPREEI